MRLQVERNPAPVWFRALIPLISILLTFLLTSGFVLAYGANPLQAAYYFLLDPLSNPVRLIEVLVKTTPLLLTGIAVAFAFSGGYWNIGAEGQLYMGATAATAIGLQMQDTPAWLAVPLVIVGGILDGMAWPAIRAVLIVQLKFEKVATTLSTVTINQSLKFGNQPFHNVHTMRTDEARENETTDKIRTIQMTLINTEPFIDSPSGSESCRHRCGFEPPPEFRGRVSSREPRPVYRVRLCREIRTTHF